jgi:DNA-binding NarL/FixJ family response regulator
MARSKDDEIIAKLDQILKVLSLQVGADQGLTERARLLKLAGLDNQTIAEALNISVEAVRALTANARVKPPKRR